MNEELISVIIPVYNTSEYLSKCLLSVINNSFKNLEIICINDGSTDNSLSVLEELSKKFPLEEFQLVGICADLYDKNGNLKQSQLDKAQSLMNDSGTTFPHMIPTWEMVVFFKSVIPGYPTTFFVDQNGKIIDSASGSNDLEGWSERVEKVLSSIE